MSLGPLCSQRWRRKERAFAAASAHTTTYPRRLRLSRQRGRRKSRRACSQADQALTRQDRDPARAGARCSAAALPQPALRRAAAARALASISKHAAGRQGWGAGRTPGWPRAHRRLCRQLACWSSARARRAPRPAMSRRADVPRPESARTPGRRRGARNALCICPDTALAKRPAWM